MPVEVELHHDWDAVAQAAHGALGRASCPSLFERLSWFRLIADHAPPPGRLLAVHARSGEASAWLFLAVEGGCARAFANWYSLRFSAIGGDATLLKALAASLRRQKLDRIELQPLAEDDPLPRAFADAGWLTIVDDASTSWQIDTRGMDFEAYWATRGSRLRNTVKRKGKAAGLDIAIHTEFDPQAWAAYETVYEQSWKGAEGSPAMLRALAEQEGAAGTLRLGIVSKDGEPVAAQLWLVENGQATIHKLAYVEAAREMSPGTLHSAALFRHVLDVDKVERVDFGTGGDSYKAEWMDRSASLNRLRAFNPASARGLIGIARARASSLVRRFRSR
jgi:CelD/BcsL family acetyltransferase involved in cellulose biosynthesis